MSGCPIYLALNKKKCSFLQPEITYCGFHVDGAGLHKTPEKIRAVVEAPQPDNITQLRAFLGMVNYYHRFLLNLTHTSSAVAEGGQVGMDRGLYAGLPGCQAVDGF